MYYKYLIYIRYLLVWLAFVTNNPATAQESLPDINDRVVNYVGTVIGTTVGRGECWDLADQALTHVGARFDKSSRNTIYIFGEKYNPHKDTILPGDIIQFEDVHVSYRDGNIIFNENYKHHTAIVYRINSDQSLQLAHQNTSFGGRKVALSDLNLDSVQKGKLYFYHPVQD